MWWFCLCTREFRWQPFFDSLTRYFRPPPMACDLVHRNAQQEMMQPRFTSSFIPHLLKEWTEIIKMDEMKNAHLSLVLLVASSLGPSRRWRQNDVVQQSHKGGADEAWDGNCDKPGHEDVSEQTPVHGLPGAQPTDRHHWPDLKKQVTF